MKRILLIGLVGLFVMTSILYADRTKEAPNKAYPFSFEYHEDYTLIRLFDEPPGYERFPAEKMSKYQVWLTNLPVRPNYYLVALWSEHDTVSVGNIAAILDIGVKSRGQTGPNMPIQLLYSFHRIMDRLDAIVYYNDKIDTLSYSRWLNGKYAFNAAGKMIYKPGKQREHSSTEYFRFLELVMEQNNTKSLAMNSGKIEETEIQPGDLYLQYSGDSEKAGHTAMILDICYNDDGEKLIMSAMGGDPAHSYYIPKSSRPGYGPWMTVAEFKEKLSKYGPGEFYFFAR